MKERSKEPNNNIFYILWDAHLHVIVLETHILNRFSNDTSRRLNDDEGNFTYTHF